MSGCSERCQLLAALAVVFIHADAAAVNGALPGGYGIKNASMGGAAIALPLDAVAAANNPAGMAFVPASTTFGLQVFRGNSSANYAMPGNHLENSQTELAPEGGVNWHMSPQITLGLSIAGSGAGTEPVPWDTAPPRHGLSRSVLKRHSFKGDPRQKRRMKQATTRHKPNGKTEQEHHFSK